MDKGLKSKGTGNVAKIGDSFGKAGTLVGSKHLFFSKEGAAVVANDGTLVTVIPKSKFDDAYKALSISLFGK